VELNTITLTLVGKTLLSPSVTRSTMHTTAI
jgi:hypothetical protein